MLVLYLVPTLVEKNIDLGPRSTYKNPLPELSRNFEICHKDIT